MQTNGTIVVGEPHACVSRGPRVCPAGCRQAERAAARPCRRRRAGRPTGDRQVGGRRRRQHADGAVPITVDAGAGAPGRVLVEAADGADLLGRGHRGRGAVRSAQLGSVGLYCVLHPPCPVTLVGSAASDEPVVAGAATV